MRVDDVAGNIAGRASGSRGMNVAPRLELSFQSSQSSSCPGRADISRHVIDNTHLQPRCILEYLSKTASCFPARTTW